jgi:hypothetical protein
VGEGGLGFKGAGLRSTLGLLRGIGFGGTGDEGDLDELGPDLVCGVDVALRRACVKGFGEYLDATNPHRPLIAVTLWRLTIDLGNARQDLNQEMLLKN